MEWPVNTQEAPAQGHPVAAAGNAIWSRGPQAPSSPWSHRLVQVADTLDWIESEKRAQRIREKKLKRRAGAVVP